MPQIILNGVTLEYKLIRKKKKNIGIRITPEGDIVVSVPLRASAGIIDDIVKSKAGWIVEKVRLMKGRSPVKRDFSDGEDILFLGESYKIRVLEYSKKRTQIIFANGVFEIHIYKDIPQEQRRSVIGEALKKWYKGEARSVFEERTKVYSEKLKLYPERLTIKEQKSVWGSCSSKGNINYNYKLVLAPIWIIDYIVVHELCHLRHRDHSKNFWGLVESILPDFKERRQWLKVNGSGLSVI